MKEATLLQILWTLKDCSNQGSVVLVKVCANRSTEQSRELMKAQRDNTMEKRSSLQLMVMEQLYINYAKKRM